MQSMYDVRCTKQSIHVGGTANANPNPIRVADQKSVKARIPSPGLGDVIFDQQRFTDL